MRLIKELFEKNSLLSDQTRFQLSRDARCIALCNKKIALLFNKNQNFYQLPGGKIKGQESILTSLTKDIVRETGHEITVAAFIGITLEYFVSQEIIQITYAYAGHVTKKKLNEDLFRTDPENELVWVKMEEALEYIQKGTQITEEIQFLVDRDSAILRELLN